ncbi:MAG: gliding motility-associated ABC transporter substrate-binding protein GldG [Flavobacteriaceae bacterium]
MKTQQNNNIKQLFYVVLGIIVLNIIGSFVYQRFDMTHDKRYTLQDATKDLLRQVNTPLEFTVLLQGEDFPSEFRRLQQETKQLLEEFRGINSNIRFVLEDLLEGEADINQTMLELDEMGLTPTNIPITKQGNQSIVRIFPWAIGYDEANQRSVRVPLLINNLGVSASENIQKSVEQLEYAFADAIAKLTIKEKKSIAVLKGNGQIDDKYMADFITSLKPYYEFGEFDLKELQNDNNQVIKNLDRFDLTIIAKPTKPFSERERYILDQYIMKGKKTMWLIDQVKFDLDSLANPAQRGVALVEEDLNLDDMLFRYGVRINYNLIQDYISVPITMKDQNGQDLPLDWWYSVMIPSKDNHLINKNVNVIKHEFANSIDTLANEIQKTILLESSNMSRTVGVPLQIELFQFQGEAPFAGKPSITGVLLEGNFTSAYKNRVKPFDYPNPKDDGVNSKMIVISDGDIVNYMYANKKFLPNGYDLWTEQIYGNKDFLMNAAHFLLDDSGIISIRAKEVKLAFFDKEKIRAKYLQSQIITVGLPIVFLTVFGVMFNYLRRRKYTKKLS